MDAVAANLTATNAFDMGPQGIPHLRKVEYLRCDDGLCCSRQRRAVEYLVDQRSLQIDKHVQYCLRDTVERDPADEA